MKTRLYVAGTLAGLAALAVAVVVVFAFGRHNPSPPSLSNAPNPAIPGEILYINEDQCFVRAQASGAGEEQLACLPQQFFPGSLYWIDDGTAAAIQFGVAGPMLHEIDLRTGQISPGGRPVSIPEKQPPFEPYGGSMAPDETYASFDENGTLSLLKDGTRTEIASFDIPRYNQPRGILWSPDSQWILAQYYPRHGNGPELWVISRDGNTRGTLTKDVWQGEGVAWRIEGVGTQPPLPQ